MRASQSLVRTGPRRGGAAQPIVDRFAETRMWNWRDGDAIRAQSVEFAQQGEKPRRSLFKASRRRQIADAFRRPKTPPEIKASLAGIKAQGVEPEFRARRVMRGEGARRDDRSAVRRVNEFGAERLFDQRSWNAARTEQARPTVETGDDRRIRRQPGRARRRERDRSRLKDHRGHGRP